jgi:hypothetical protein
VRAAVEREMARVVNAPNGTRNEALNKAAYALGGYLGSGMLDPESLRRDLFRAAEQNGLVAEDGGRAVVATIKSGITGGHFRPRQVPSLSIAEEAPHPDDGAHKPRKRLSIGSDVEIARRLAEELEQQFGQVIFAEGLFWRYAGHCWTAIHEAELRRRAHDYDGALYGIGGTVRLGKNRIDSIIRELGVVLGGEPDFFANPAVGINCATGFIQFAEDGAPRLVPHHSDHKRRHVLLGHYPARSSNVPAHESLLTRLLVGCFKGDPKRSRRSIYSPRSQAWLRLDVQPSSLRRRRWFWSGEPPRTAKAKRSRSCAASCRTARSPRSRSASWRWSRLM